MTTGSNSSECCGPGRPRCEVAKAAVLGAALTMLRRSGFEDLTIEGVATKAGVAKTTVYRWWPDKAGLAIDAFFAAVSPRLPFGDTGSIRGDFRAQMMLVVQEMTGPDGRVLAGILSAVQTDRQAARAFRERWLWPRRAEAEPAIRRAIDRGELPAGTDIPAMLDALYGPLYLRLMLGHGRLDAVFIDTLVDGVFGGFESGGKVKSRVRLGKRRKAGSGRD